MEMTEDKEEQQRCTFTWDIALRLVSFVGWMVFEIEALEGISCSKQMKYLIYSHTHCTERKQHQILLTGGLVGRQQ